MMIKRNLNKLLLFLVILFTSTFAFSKPTIHLYIFSSSDCSSCEIVKPENIKKLGEKLKVEIEPKYFNIDQFANYQKLTELETKYKDTDNKIPVVFVGKYVLGGKEEIGERLEEIISQYAEKGVGGPDEIIIGTKREKGTDTFQTSPVYIAFFYEFACKECQRVFYLLKYLEKKYPNLVTKKFNLAEKENKVLFEAIAERVRIPEQKRLIPATLIIGSDYLQQKDVNLKNIEHILAHYAKTGSLCIWNLKKEEIENAEKNIVKKFNSFGIAAVSFAGLIDGVNPCAFAVLVFFISYLTVIKKKGKEIFLVGISFMLSVFLVYFLIGCGALSFLSKFSSYNLFSRILNILVGIGAIVLGILSFFDFLKARKGKTKDISLQLPKLIKTKIHSTIMRKMNLPNYIMGAFVAGVIVSLLEFACTGQVYLPTIVFVLNQSEFKVKGILYLLIYNFMFIFPLVIILLLSLLGTTSQKLSSISRKNLPAIKFILFVFFFFIGSYLLLKGLPVFLINNKQLTIVQSKHGF